VVQVYLADEAADVVRPLRRLQGFAKVELVAGEAREVVVALSSRAFANFDTAAQVWCVPEGRFRVMVGFSAGDIRLSAEVTRRAEVLPV
jgi:beta-glucosidase